MNNKYVLIVGGAGYIGSHVNKELNRKGYKTLILDNLIYGHPEYVKWGRFILGDMSDQNLLRLIFSKYPIATVMHFAAFAYVGESVHKPDVYYQNNVSATLNLLSVMKEFKVDTFIFSSSCATYGIPVQTPILETDPQHPINPYGRSKLMVEQILKDYSHAYGLKFVSLRYFNAAGADLESEIGENHCPETHLIPLILDSAIGKRKAVSVFGTDYNTPDGTCIRDYIHVADLARAHALALEYLLQSSDSLCLNLGNGNGYSVLEVIDVAKKITNRDFSVIKTARRDGDPAILVCDARKAKEILNWEPRYDSLETILSSAWNWHQKLCEI